MAVSGGFDSHTLLPDRAYFQRVRKRPSGQTWAIRNGSNCRLRMDDSRGADDKPTFAGAVVQTTLQCCDAVRGYLLVSQTRGARYVSAYGMARTPRFRLCGGSTWESNPSLAPRRSETAVLRTVSDTGHLVPPLRTLFGFLH